MKIPHIDFSNPTVKKALKVGGTVFTVVTAVAGALSSQKKDELIEKIPMMEKTIDELKAKIKE